MTNTNTANQNQMDTRTMQISREQEIAAVINARYSTDDQLAILRQRDTKPEEYAAFNAFAEQVKADVTASRAAKAAGAGGSGE